MPKRDSRRQLYRVVSQRLSIQIGRDWNRWKAASRSFPAVPVASKSNRYLSRYDPIKLTPRISFWHPLKINSATRLVLVDRYRSDDDEFGTAETYDSCSSHGKNRSNRMDVGRATAERSLPAVSRCITAGTLSILAQPTDNPLGTRWPKLAVVVNIDAT